MGETLLLYLIYLYYLISDHINVPFFQRKKN